MRYAAATSAPGLRSPLPHLRVAIAADRACRFMSLRFSMLARPPSALDYRGAVRCDVCGHAQSITSHRC